MNQLAHLLNEIDNLSDLFVEINHYLKDIFPFDALQLWHYDPMPPTQLSLIESSFIIPPIEKTVPLSQYRFLQHLFKNKTALIWQQEESIPHPFQIPDLQTIIFLPLFSNKQPIALLVIQFSSDHHSILPGVDELKKIAPLFSLSIAKLFAQEKTNTHLLELAILKEASIQFSKTYDQPSLLHQIIVNALRLVGADDVYIFLWEDGALSFKLAYDAEGNTIAPNPYIRPYGLTQTVATRGETIVVLDTRTHDYYRMLPWIGSIIGLPLWAGKELQGVMTVAFKQLHQFIPTQLTALELLAEQVAMSLYNIKLYQEVQSWATQLEHLVTERTNSLAIAATKNEEITKQLELVNKHLLAQTQELKLANQDLQQFAYIVSHDLKTPLRNVAYLAHWLKTDDQIKLTAKGEELLDLMNERLDQMQQLIDEILLYSKAGQLKTDLEQPAIDLTHLIHDILLWTVPSDKATVILETAFPTIQIDQISFTQVLQNLLENSLKFGAHKETLQINLGMRQDESYWTFYVHDNGPGIATEYLPRVFTMFQTFPMGNNVTNSGIGLAIVYKLVHLWGGEVWVESTVNQGATFTFTIPIKD